ncbi:MAG: choice-of-anchor D domain-containing protein [Labilithrix sp.]|nr:choice-of-anchor D domain-containing protein [Labilithrix sp.]MCW5816446.1 choice-of-anchor D domain-containing protein [Labilithrix sp.]
MRAHTISAAVRFGMMTAAVLGLTLATSEARAQGDVDSEGPSASAPNSSIGSASLKYEHGKGLESSIQTGWVGPSIVQANVGIKVDPVTNGGPLFVVDMPKGANVEASWGDDKKIILKAQTGGSNDGLVSVRHTLTPSMDLKLSAFGLNATFSYDATDLLNKMKGANFRYDSKAQQPFAPWGFTAVSTKLNAPDLAAAELFTMQMSEMPDFVANNVTGEFGVRAVSKPTFTYKTTKVTISGAAGQIADGSSELVIDAADGDYLEVMTAVEGNMEVTGGISVQPFVFIDKVASINAKLNVGYDVYTKDFTTPATAVNFQTVLVHIPMPNVRAPKNVDLGAVKVGGSATKKVIIENTGEKDATMSFSSSNPAFKVEGGTVSVPAKSKYELSVKFEPESAAAASADITIASNDADSPLQTFKIGANGADVEDDEESDGSTKSAGAEGSDGCGCKAAGHSTTPGWAGLGLIGLGAMVLVRRRRTA